MTNNRELEFKYNADNVSLKDFKALKISESQIDLDTPTLYIDAYFVNNDNNIIRFRQYGNNYELAIKVNDKNTIEDRLEIEMFLDQQNTDNIHNFLKLLGYTLKSTIFKTTYTKHFKNVELYYSIISNDNHQELGRIIEIESYENSLERLEQIETSISCTTPLNLNPYNRLKKSNFDLFIK